MGQTRKKIKAHIDPFGFQLQTNHTLFSPYTLIFVKEYENVPELNANTAEHTF